MSEAGNCYSVNLPVWKRKQVIVVGGGPTGVVAALSARRNGADVLLIERASYLGGMMTGGGIGGIGIDGYLAGVPGKPVVVKGIAMSILKRLQAAGGAETEDVLLRYFIDPAMMVHLLDEMMAEANIEVLFNTVAFDAIKEGDAVKGVAVANKSGGQVILADVVIDASADADIATAAGVPFEAGRRTDGRRHGGSLDMEIGGIDFDRFLKYLKDQLVLNEKERAELEADRKRLLGGGGDPNTVYTLDGKRITREPNVIPTSWEDVARARQEGRMPRLRIATVGGGPMPGMAPVKDGKYMALPAALDKEWIDYIKAGKVPPLLGAARLVYPPPRFGSHGGGIGVFRHGKIREGHMMSGTYETWFDATSEEETTKALMYMRKLNQVYFDFLRERIPGFENAYIVMESPMAGIRESRRIVGDYVLTEDDQMQGRKFPDVIAKGGPRAPDAHSVTGVWGDGINAVLTKVYDIPYRCLVPKKVDNLLVGGRCISATHLAFGAIRDMATGMSTGEAAGAAAALAIRSGVTPRYVDVKALQRALLAQDVLLFTEEEKAREEELRQGQTAVR